MIKKRNTLSEGNSKTQGVLRGKREKWRQRKLCWGVMYKRRIKVKREALLPVATLGGQNRLSPLTSDMERQDWELVLLGLGLA